MFAISLFVFLLLFGCVIPQTIWATNTTPFGAKVHVTTPRLDSLAEMSAALVPLDVAVEASIAERVVTAVSPDLPFFPPPAASAFRRAQMEDEAAEL